MNCVIRPEKDQFRPVSGADGSVGLLQFKPLFQTYDFAEDTVGSCRGRHVMCQDIGDRDFCGQSSRSARAASDKCPDSIEIPIETDHDFLSFLEDAWNIIKSGRSRQSVDWQLEVRADQHRFLYQEHSLRW
jgi:hypothetical protein